MSDTFSGARRSQIVFAVLLAVCVAQVGWWILDQWMYASELQAQAEASWQQDVAAAQALLATGTPADEVSRLFPTLEIDDAGNATVGPETRAAVEDELGSRLNRYVWEGAFFLVVLLAAIAALWRTTNVEFRLRRRQENFVTAVTHELKSPLASIRLAAETLEYREADRETRERLVQRLLRSLDRMEGTVSNVLETARVDERKVALEPDHQAIATLLEEIATDLEPVASGAGVSLTVSAPEELTAWADRRAFTTVVRNLVANAVSATSETDGATIEINGLADSNNAVVEVRDNGRGFLPEDTEKLFEKFYRPGDELRRASRGTGLGLYIARNLMQESGGRLDAFSEGPGCGAVFRATWPQSAAGAP